MSPVSKVFLSSNLEFRNKLKFINESISKPDRSSLARRWNRGFTARFQTLANWSIQICLGFRISRFEFGALVGMRRCLANSVLVLFAAAHLLGNIQSASGQDEESKVGYIQTESGHYRFPIGFYELPKDDDALKAMTEAGVNLVRCRNRGDLDRAHAAGLMGWVSLGVQQGATDALRTAALSVADHPALAVWEGPDEIVWTFTAYSFLERTAGFTREDWNNQTPKAVNYARKQSATIIPNIRDGIRLVRELDQRNLPFWINEAADSDMKYVRGYVDSIDITGCDYYAVRSTGTDLQSVGRLVDRWHAIGRGKPVWMVLQAFSWHTMRPERSRLFPSFTQSRFMAYDAIVHGARGIFYFGSQEIDDSSFRESLYALTSELAALEPLLTGTTDHNQIRVHVVDDLFDPPGKGVRALLRQHGSDFLLILVNEDPHRHLGVDVSGLEVLNGRNLELLYGSEGLRVERGGFVTRLQGFDVKVFSTNSEYVSRRRAGRDYKD